MYKQIIIVRKDLDMSPGKLAAQVSHASMAFLTNMIRDNAVRISQMTGSGETVYRAELFFEQGLYEEWIGGAFTKVILQAKNRSQLLKAKKYAEEMRMAENTDYFLIKDNCRTELEPEEVDENGNGRTLTCIGFAPMDSESIDQIGRHFQLLR